MYFVVEEKVSSAWRGMNMRIQVLWYGFRGRSFVRTGEEEFGSGVARAIGLGPMRVTVPLGLRMMAKLSWTFPVVSDDGLL